MTPIADMVRRMLEKGVAHDAIVLAVEGAEQALLSTRHPPDNGVDEAAEKRRAWDREYRRRTRPSTRHPPESTRHPPDRESTSLSTSTIENLSVERERPRKKNVHLTRGQRLPDDWQPSPQDHATSEALLGPLRVRAELEKFRDHWKQQPGAKGVKLDWNAAWRNWARRAVEYGGKFNGSSQATGVVAVAKRFAEQFESEQRDGLEGNPNAVLRLSAR